MERALQHLAEALAEDPGVTEQTRHAAHELLREAQAAADNWDRAAELYAGRSDQ